MVTTTDAPDDGNGPRYREEQERFGVVRLVVEVRDDGLYVRLGPLQRTPRRVPVDAIESVEATTYSPSTHAGWHWGVRWNPFGDSTVYRLAGEAGVRVVHSGGKVLFVGTDRPERLRDAIRAVVDPE